MFDIQNFQSSSQDVSVAIGLQSCATHRCFAPNDTLGTLLTFGPYAPNLKVNPASQSYHVTIPSATPKGLAQLGVAHFALIGVSFLITSKLVQSSQFIL